MKKTNSVENSARFWGAGFDSLWKKLLTMWTTLPEKLEKRKIKEKQNADRFRFFQTFHHFLNGFSWKNAKEILHAGAVKNA